MPREFSRTRRVGGQLRRELSELIRDQMDDPRMAMVSITGVEVTRDLGHAKVFFTFLGDASVRGTIAAGLNHAAPQFRHVLGRRMHIRVVPQLRFVYDVAIENGARLEALIATARAEDRSRHPETDDGEGD